MPFRRVFGDLLSRSTRLDTAMHRVRLSGVDLSEGEVGGLERLRLLVAEVNAQTLEEEAFALLMDPERRENLTRVLALLQAGRMELRSAPLAGWSPDFSVFSGPQGPLGLILGLHWIHSDPFPTEGRPGRQPSARKRPNEAASVSRRSGMAPMRSVPPSVDSLSGPQSGGNLLDRGGSLLEWVCARCPSKVTLWERGANRRGEEPSTDLSRR